MPMPRPAGLGGRENAGQSYTARQWSNLQTGLHVPAQLLFNPWAIYSAPGIYSYIHIWPKQEQAPLPPVNSIYLPMR